MKVLFTAAAGLATGLWPYLGMAAPVHCSLASSEVGCIAWQPEKHGYSEACWTPAKQPAVCVDADISPFSCAAALQAAAGLAPAPTPTAADVYSNWTCPRGSCVTTLASNGEYVADLFGIANSDCTAIIGMRAECSDGQGTQLLLGDGPISLNNSSSLISASGAAGCFNGEAWQAMRSGLHARPVEAIAC